MKIKRSLPLALAAALALAVGAALLAATMVVTPAAAAPDDAARADHIKAAYVFNFLKFIEWPAGAPDEAIEVCFAGAPGVHKSLQSAAAEKRIGARRVAVRALAVGEGPGHCAVVYLGEAMDGAVLQNARSSSLTVSDAPNFTRRGGAIQLFTEENRLRFVINVENARRAGLRISSNLLKLASNVEQDGAP